MCGVEVVIESLNTSFSKIQSRGQRFGFERHQLSYKVKLREIGRGVEQELQRVVGGWG